MANSSSPRVYSRDSRNHQLVQNNNNCSSSSTSTPPLVLSLSQIQGGGGLLILNSNSSNNSSHQSLVNPVSVTNFVCNTNRSLQKDNRTSHLVLKQEVMDTNPSCLLSNQQQQNIKSNQRETKMESNEILRQSVFNDGSLYTNTHSRYGILFKINFLLIYSNLNYSVPIWL